MKTYEELIQELKDRKSAGFDNTKEVIEFIGECVGWNQENLAKDLLTPEFIDLTYLERHLLNDLKESLDKGKHGSVLLKLGQDEDAQEMMKEAKFFVLGQNALSLMQNSEIAQTNEFLNFLVQLSHTHFDTSPKPKLTIV